MIGNLLTFYALSALTPAAKRHATAEKQVAVIEVAAAEREKAARSL